MNSTDGIPDAPCLVSINSPVEWCLCCCIVKKPFLTMSHNNRRSDRINMINDRVDRVGRLIFYRRVDRKRIHRRGGATGTGGR